MQVQKALLSCKENRQDGGDRMSINSIAKEKKRNDWVCLAEMLWSVGFPSKILPLLTAHGPQSEFSPCGRFSVHVI